ncbi:hypothetical protein CC1G_14805 [Coprinopsis cinerea okayama7|uniref:Uncharacterized protein n=1 Tax=Coprinopsis cinerea (strain Okayama-7 / 130 / ATCC MYA-4618 / FGSC 9003) TaxID=240176 RepID=D6RNN3_COPC7|nr:hypothetical protein CC1G_14805 [Coprinopsis cinerea okayama7\|eukprot:XP_002910826.1 hypothetical protein CC1G_14805 [Coprinopsis cinerea okayama7\
MRGSGTASTEETEGSNIILPTLRRLTVLDNIYPSVSLSQFDEILKIRHPDARIYSFQSFKTGVPGSSAATNVNQL